MRACVYARVRVCACACARACVHVCMRACPRACLRRACVLACACVRAYILLTQASPLRWPFVNVENGGLERFRIYCGEGVVGHLGWGRVIAHRDLSGNLLLACELYCYCLWAVVVGRGCVQDVPHVGGGDHTSNTTCHVVCDVF